MSISRLAVVEGIPPGWDRSVADDVPVTMRARWIELAAARLPGGYRTFLVPDGDRLGVALGGGVLAEPTGHPRFDPYQVLSGRSAPAGVAPAGPYPWQDVRPEQVFPCCLLMFPNYETVPIGTGGQDRAALRAYVDELLTWCKAEGIRSVAGLFLHREPEAMCAVLDEAGFALLPMIERAGLAVTWTDFDGYLAALPKKRRSGARGELKALADKGVRISHRPLSRTEPELVELRSQLIGKYGGTPDPQREATMLETIHDCFGPRDVTVFEARGSDKLLSFGLFIQDGSHWTGLMTGTDYADPDSAFTHFATFFYRPAALAPELGIRRIDYGIGALEAKRIRGCTTRTLYAAGRILD